MRLFLIIAVISFLNNLILTYDRFCIMIAKIMESNFYTIICHENLLTYFKYIIKQVIYLVFFYTW